MPAEYTRMAKALRYIHTHAARHPSLGEIAGSVRLSPYHFQRSFRRWVGVSPKRYLQDLTVERAKAGLRRRATVLETAYDVGLSGPGRLHDLFVSVESVTPGEYKSLGESLTLRIGVHWTPLGPCGLALTERGICALRFLEEGTAAEAEGLLAEDWPRSRLRHDPERTAKVVHRIFHGRLWDREEPFHLLLRGTNFQIQVWRALLRIPPGKSVSYGRLSTALGRSPSHARAVAGAVAANPIAFLIPCHRVIRASGALGGYRWGIERKKRILSAEER